jgi:hypothetical protein
MRHMVRERPPRGENPEPIGHTTPDGGFREREQALRKQLIQKLAVDFLHSENPGFTNEGIAVHLFAGGDIFEGTLEEQQEKLRDRLNSGDMPLEKSAMTALNFARFYWDNEIGTIPSRVIRLQGIQNKDFQNDADPNEKVLYVLNHWNQQIQFKDKVTKQEKQRWVTRNVDQDVLRPDVYVEDVITSIWLSNKSEAPSPITIAGSDNLIFGANTAKSLTGTAVLEINLRCEGNLAFLPGSRLDTKKREVWEDKLPINIYSGADIIQYPGSTVAVTSVDCINYTRGERNELYNPLPNKGNSKIRCIGEFRGELPDSIHMDVYDLHHPEGANGKERKIAAAAAMEGVALHPVEETLQDVPKKTEETAPETSLDEHFPPLFKNTMEKEGGTITIQSHEISPDSITEFFHKAILEGWDIANYIMIEKSDGSKVISVSLKK